MHKLFAFLSPRRDKVMFPTLVMGNESFAPIAACLYNGGLGAELEWLC